MVFCEQALPDYELAVIRALYGTGLYEAPDGTLGMIVCGVSCL